MSRQINNNTTNKNILFIFRRDLRINDNTGFIHALNNSDHVFPIFIFTPEQIGNENKYRSQNAIDFMIECLAELRNMIPLHCFYGDNIKIIEQCIITHNINCVVFNRDYTPYSIERDQKIINCCHRHNIECNTFGDLYLIEPGTTVENGGIGKPVLKFTPFYEKYLQLNFRRPNNGKPKIQTTKFITDKNDVFDKIKDKFYIKPSHNNSIIRVATGGRIAGIKCLNHAVHTQQDYLEHRNFPAINTSRMSAHLKFGTISIREVYYAFANRFGGDHEIIRQFIWRDFFAQLLFYYPDNMRGKLTKYGNTSKWRNNESRFEKWCKGETGFPMVDAGIRELLNTGFMHNRCRMVVASFLVKTLGIDWKKGEQFYAKHLTDYDVASNNGNWQNISSTGKYGEAPFRVMNPWIQSFKFDRNATYIKKWIPELTDVDPDDIHKWHESCHLSKYKHICSLYTKPIVIYEIEKEKTQEIIY